MEKTIHLDLGYWEIDFVQTVSGTSNAVSSFLPLTMLLATVKEMYRPYGVEKTTDLDLGYWI